MTEEDKTIEALDYLESQGFYVRNLWHIDDVQNRFECEDHEAFDILDDAVCGEWIMSTINERIVELSTEAGYKPIDDEEDN